MKHYKKVQRIAEVIDHETCDKCGKQVDHLKNFETNDFTIEWRLGDHYPDGGAGVVRSIDLCFACRGELFKMLEDNGYRINSQEYDW